MKQNAIDLRSVNWEHGMLVVPDHFLRQEKYIDSNILWGLRYCTQAYGLIGEGPRAWYSKRNGGKHDPIIDLHEDEQTISVSISQCRGLSPAGDIIDIDRANPVNVSLAKQDLNGVNEVGVYVVCTPHEKIVEDELTDPVNPQMRSSRRRRYSVKLGITAAEAAHSLVLGRLRKSDRTLRYEKVSGFIPVCTTMMGHGDLMRAWAQLNEQLVQLADRYSDLHKAIAEYISMAKPRGISTEEDQETLRFVGRMVVALEACANEVIDPRQSPQRYFQRLYHTIRSSAVCLDISPPTGNYFRQLAQEVETEFQSMLDQERQTLLSTRDVAIDDDLSVEVERIKRGFFRLGRLEEGLEGKYLDFRVSSALEALSFFFERQTGALYRSVGKPVHPQLFRDELTFVFAPLKLAGRQRYRLVLIGNPDAKFERGARLGAEIRLNFGTGEPHMPIHGSAPCEIYDQRNFAIDFDVPSGVHTISDMRVIINASWQIKTCILYQRRRLGAQQDYSAESPLLEPQPLPRPELPPATPGEQMEDIDRDLESSLEKFPEQRNEKGQPQPRRRPGRMSRIREVQS